MQIMPATAKGLGIENVHDPEQSIKGGLKYLNKLYNYWSSVPDSIQRIKFALASYNCGYGHVIDAKALAKKHKKDTLNWDNGVDEFILKLSKPKYYRDPVVRSGYVRGSEPYNYVNDIFYRFKHYKDFVDE
jgi:membrane-bound lytic murein transglycosylase F